MAKKQKTVLRDLRAREAKLAAELSDVRKQIRAEEARQASIQGNGLGEMMRKRYAELHPEANLDDLTPEQIFELVLADQAAKPAEEKTAAEASTDGPGDLAIRDDRETVDNDAEESMTDDPADDYTPEQSGQKSDDDCKYSDQQLFRF